jgi:hypothetical protein
MSVSSGRSEVPLETAFAFPRPLLLPLALPMICSLVPFALASGGRYSSPQRRAACSRMSGIILRAELLAPAVGDVVAGIGVGPLRTHKK